MAAPRSSWPLRADGTQKTMGEMSPDEQDRALAPVLEALARELAETLPRFVAPRAPKKGGR